MSPDAPTVAVVGAGILGSTTALLLAREGITVDLIDARTGVWRGASGTGEGKVHLGFVYALAGAETLQPLMSGSLAFATVMDRAVGRQLDWRALASEPFDYLVHPDSILPSGDLVRHYRRVVASIAEEGARLGSDCSYLGWPIVEACRVGTPIRDAAGRLRIRTAERAVDVVRLRRIVEGALRASSRVSMHLGTRVKEAATSARGIALSADSGGRERTLGPYLAVVNAAWDYQAALDAGPLGEIPPREANYRLRAFISGQSARPLQPVTIVQGPFGDLVSFVGGRTYASWYPVGLLGFAGGSEPPKGWDALEKSVEADPDLARYMLDGLGSALGQELRLHSVRTQARVVVAEGDTDISDRNSGLHHRLVPNIVVRDGWVSPRSPKLTTGPQVAAATVDVVRGLLA